MSTGPVLPAVEAVLATLRRGQRQLTRNPRAAVEAAVEQLLALGHVGTPDARSGDLPTGPDGLPATYRIDDLARVSGVTVRNIRAYQERGLLPPPRRQGRTALFDDAHLARLGVISSMLERGYTAANILEMLNAWEHGRGLGEVLGLEGVLVPARVDAPVVVTLAEARRLCGGQDDLELLLAAGLVERSGRRTRVLRPQLLEAFAEMRAHGMTTATLVAIHAEVEPASRHIASVLVGAAAEHLAPRLAGDDPPTVADVAALVELLTRFRTLAMSAVTATLAIPVEQAIQALLADYVAAAVLTDVPPAALPGALPAEP